MVQTFNATRTLTDDITLTDTLEFFKTKLLQNINTIILGEIIEVDNTNKRLTVQSLINGVDSKNKPIIPPVIYEVPYGTIRGGNAGLITQYKKSDNVIIGFCQRQIESTKRTGKRSTPALIRFHNLADAVVLSHWSNDEPEIFIKILENGITMEAKNTPININTTSDLTATVNNANITCTGDITAQSVNANINATGQTTITSPTINLMGNVVINGDLTSTTATIGGVSFNNHTHGAGTYSNNAGAVTGNSGSPQ